MRHSGGRRGAGPDGQAHARARRRGASRALAVAGGAGVLALLVGALLWHLTGGRWEIVATPSMGQAAPVGSLVLVRPVGADQLAVGDIVTYRPPTSTVAHTVTHRVVDVVATGPRTTLRTRGDNNGADDPWTLHSGNLVGRVVWIGWGLGWLVKALPLLLTGGVALWWTTGRWASTRWRIPLRVLGASLLVSVASAVVRPFIGAVSLGTTTDAAGTHVALVSTGLLPVRISAPSGGSVDLVDGQVGILTTRLPEGVKGVALTSAPHLSVGLWALMALVWLTPMLCGLVAGWSSPPSEGDGDPDPRVDDTAPLSPGTPPGVGPLVPALTGRASTAEVHPPVRRRRLRQLAVVGLAVASGLVLGSVTPTAAAFSGQVGNTTNTAATNPYFTCASATTSPGAASTYLAWPLDDATVTSGSTARDVSGNARAGTYTGPFARTTSRPCPRDTGTSAVTLAPTSSTQSYVASPTPSTTNPTVFSLALWFNTTTTTGGRMIGWGNARTGQSSSYDRHIYMTNSGKLTFGVYPNAVKVVTSPNSYNDGTWHQVVATLSSAGMALYVDGVQVAADATVTSAENTTGYWRVGWDNLNAWTNVPTTAYWSGSLAWAAVYTNLALTAAQVRQSYVAGT